MINSIAFTVYPVTDMKRARNFYEQTLGLKLSEDFGGKWVEYDLGEGTFAITNMMEDCKPGGAGASIAFEVDDMDECVKKLKAANVQFKMDVFATPVCRIAVINDPDGNAINIHKRNA